MWHEIASIMGLTSPNSAWYLFWSGFGADWTRIGVIFTIAGTYLHHHRKTKKSVEDDRRSRSEGIAQLYHSLSSPPSEER